MLLNILLNFQAEQPYLGWVELVVAIGSPESCILRLHSEHGDLEAFILRADDKVASVIFKRQGYPLTIEVNIGV